MFILLAPGFYRVLAVCVLKYFAIKPDTCVMQASGGGNDVFKERCAEEKENEIKILHLHSRDGFRY